MDKYAGNPLINMAQNRIPDRVEKIHMIAVCGTGMGALACMLQDMGYDVTGSDANIYPPMSDFLIQKGIRLYQGFTEKNLGSEPDLVIIGNAVPSVNPEAVEVMKKGIPFCSMPQALNFFAADGKKIILVTGTHGKTTTASIMAHLLYTADLDPGFMIGGILKGFNSNYRLGNGEYIVIEGDEYDTAFFDKGAKFLHFDPFITIITSVEFDHADIFSNLDHVKQVFRQLVEKIPEQRLILACDGDENVKDVLKNCPGRIRTYGKGAADILFEDAETAQDAETMRRSARYTAKINTGTALKINTPLMGTHNIMNSLAAAAAAQDIGISDRDIVKGMKTFAGIKRRQEIRGVKNQITIMDDFAHHPTAVRETLAAVKPFYQKGRVIAVFEPRTNSSMRNIFQHIYPAAFDNADLVCVCRPSKIEKIPRAERFSSRQLAEDINKRGGKAFYFENADAIVDFLKLKAAKEDLILIMSNGGFDNIHQKLFDAL